MKFKDPAQAAVQAFWGLLLIGGILLLGGCSEGSGGPLKAPERVFENLSCVTVENYPNGTVVDTLAIGERTWNWSRTWRFDGEVERSESGGTLESVCNEHECEVWWVAYKNGTSRKPWKSMVIWGAQGRHSIDGLGYECEGVSPP